MSFQASEQELRLVLTAYCVTTDLNWNDNSFSMKGINLLSTLNSKRCLLLMQHAESSCCCFNFKMIPFKPHSSWFLFFSFFLILTVDCIKREQSGGYTHTHTQRHAALTRAGFKIPEDILRSVSLCKDTDAKPLLGCVQGYWCQRLLIWQTVESLLELWCRCILLFTHQSKWRRF